MADVLTEDEVVELLGQRGSRLGFLPLGDLIRVGESHEALRSRLADAEAERDKLQSAIAKHHNQHADDLCWMDDNELYIVAGLPPRDATTGDPLAMLENCKRYIRQRCQGAGDWPSYAELEQRIADLTARLDATTAELEAVRAERHRGPTLEHGGVRIISDEVF